MILRTRARLTSKHKLYTGAVSCTACAAGFRALKWPFHSKDVGKTVQALGRSTQAISLALHIDQMYRDLSIP